MQSPTYQIPSDDQDMENEFLTSDLVIEDDCEEIDMDQTDIANEDKNEIMNLLTDDIQQKNDFMQSEEYSNFVQVLVISQITLNFTNDDPFFRHITNIVKALRKSTKNLFVEAEYVENKAQFKARQDEMIRIFYQDINIGFITSTGQIKSTAFLYVRKEFSECLHRKIVCQKRKEKKVKQILQMQQLGDEIDEDSQFKQKKEKQRVRMTLHFYSPNALVRSINPNQPYKQQFIRQNKFQNEFIILSDEKEGEKKPYITYHVYKAVDDQIYFVKQFYLKSLPANVQFSDIFNNPHKSEYQEDIVKVIEAKTLARVTHTNILRTYDWWLESLDNKIYLFIQQEYCIYPGYISQAKNLLSYSYFYMNPMLSEQKIKLIKELMFQVISGLEYLQNRQISHGDLKPESIMVTMNINAETQIMLADFSQKYKLLKTPNAINLPKSPSPLKQKEQIYDNKFTALGVLIMHLVLTFPGEPKMRNNYVYKFQHEDLEDALHLFDGWAQKHVRNRHREFSFFLYKPLMVIAQKLLQQKIHDLHELKALLTNQNQQV